MTTATEPATSIGTVTTSAYDLSILLGSVAPFAEKEDWGTFALRCVRIEAGGGIICASATDRYHLAHVRRPAAGDLEPVYVRRDAVEEVVKRLGARAEFTGEASEQVRLTATDGRLNIEVGDHVIRPATKTVGTWPDLGKILAGAPTGSHDSDGPVGIGPNSLQVLTESLDSINRPLAVTRWSMGGPKSPVVVEYEDWFVAAFMPHVAASGDVPLNARARVPYGLPNS